MLRIASLALGLVGLGFLAAPATNAQKDDPKGKEKVEFTGKLSHPVFAIGGETTGTVIETKKGTYELDLGGKKELLKQVEALNGKQIVVRGTLKVVKGLEIPKRQIITVSEIKEVKGKDVKK
ncbi:MAG TPA: hypothetical protein VEL76_36210 [Gemmataceae bacterium]|nr:hypothetical protein [Gemmataceae bacterium]